MSLWFNVCLQIVWNTLTFKFITYMKPKIILRFENRLNLHPVCNHKCFICLSTDASALKGEKHLHTEITDLAALIILLHEYYKRHSKSDRLFGSSFTHCRGLFITPLSWATTWLMNVRFVCCLFCCGNISNSTLQIYIYLALIKVLNVPKRKHFEYYYISWMFIMC